MVDNKCGKVKVAIKLVIVRMNSIIDTDKGHLVPGLLSNIVINQFVIKVSSHGG